MKTTSSSVLPRLVPVCLAGTALTVLSLSAGCAAGNNVIASTGTVIGVQLGQGAADTTPQAKLGYNRAEFAFVPTNRAVNDPAHTASGAEQSADVLMELRYDGILSTKGGIYQRLAVGRTAVSQAGAALMFAKDSDGKIDAQQAQAIKSALDAIPTPTGSVLRSGAPLDKAYLSLSKDEAKKKVFDDAASSAGFANYLDFAAKRSTADQISKVRSELEKNADVKAALEKPTNN